MKTVKTSRLNSLQINRINTLLTELNAEYNTVLPCFYENNINISNELPCFFLTYDKGSLVAFMSLYIPYDEYCEAYILINPAYFDVTSSKKLINKNLSYLYSDVKEPLFVNNSLNTYNKHLFSSLGYKNTSSTCLYTLELTFFKSKTNKNNDTNKSINELSYTSTKKGSSLYFKLYDNNLLLGKASIQLYNTTACIHNVLISKAFRNKGFGTILLNEIINSIVTNQQHIHSVMLNVDSNNKAALALYTKFGFKCETQLDYYKY